MKKKILFIIGTHGDEKIGMEVVSKLKKIGYDKYFDYLVANPKAFEKNVRFLDFDLNRAYPGTEYSKFYEKKKAFENIKIARKYQSIIDFHEASQGRGNFIIVPRKKISTKFPLGFIDLKKVLLWPDPKGPLSQVLPNSVELEFGMKNKRRRNVIDIAFDVAKNFIEKIDSRIKIGSTNAKEIYYVYGKLSEKDCTKIKLTDFKKVNFSGEEFYPLLVDQYLKQGVKCYKMKKIN